MRSTARQFEPDAERHRQDAPRFCPACTAPLALSDGSIATEYWEASDRIFVCWCGACGWQGDIVLSERVVMYEPAH